MLKKKTYICKVIGGISHLRRHVKQCTKKHGALDPKQSQINITKIGSSTSSMYTFIFLIKKFIRVC